MTTREAAAYLRLKERKIYELVRAGRIPCARITGKLLFPKPAIDLWIMRHTEHAGPPLAPPPPVVAGSHDPLLEWALRESGCDLALLAGGSADGIQRLADGRAILAGLHILDPETGAYNVPIVRGWAGMADLVLIEWAKRTQGLVVAAGNPLAIAGPADLHGRNLRVARRQDGAGAHTLFLHLLARAGLRLRDLTVVEPPMLTETDIAGAVLEGKADCGLAVEAVANQFRLAFVALHRERFDLAMRRRDFFQPAVQRLLRFSGTEAFRCRAAELGGYDIGEAGSIAYNA